MLDGSTSTKDASFEQAPCRKARRRGSIPRAAEQSATLVRTCRSHIGGPGMFLEIARSTNAGRTTSMLRVRIPARALTSACCESRRSETSLVYELSLRSRNMGRSLEDVTRGSHSRAPRDSANAVGTTWIQRFLGSIPRQAKACSSKVEHWEKSRRYSSPILARHAVT